MILPLDLERHRGVGGDLSPEAHACFAPFEAGTVGRGRGVLEHAVVIGFAVPLRLRCDEGELQLMTTLTSFATALDVTLAELHLEAFLPANDDTARILRERERARRAHGSATGSLPPGLVVAAAGGGVSVLGGS